MKPQVTMADVIDRLFARLSATYGASWTRQWADVPIIDLKTAWGHELAGYINHLPAIAHALESLPERCPNVIQFRNLCRTYRTDDTPRIEAPKAHPAVVAKVLAGLAPAVDNPHGMRAWAHRLKARHAAGDKLSAYQVKCYEMSLA